MHYQWFYFKIRMLPYAPPKTMSALVFDGSHLLLFFLLDFVGLILDMHFIVWSLVWYSLSSLFLLSESPVTCRQFAVFGLMDNFFTQVTPYMSKKQRKSFEIYLLHIVFVIKSFMPKIIAQKIIPIKWTIIPCHGWFFLMCPFVQLLLMLHAYTFCRNMPMLLTTEASYQSWGSGWSIWHNFYLLWLIVLLMCFFLVILTVGNIFFASF